MASSLVQTTAIPRDRPIIVFDGVCVFCTVGAQFILKHDKAGLFRLTAMQSEVGAQIMREAGLDPLDPESFIVLGAADDGGDTWMNSDAVLHVWSILGWPWRAALIFRLVPHAIRDPLYRLIARNRYKWFGKREECWVPTPDQAARVL